MLRYPKVLLFSADKEEAAVLHNILGRHVAVTPVHDPEELSFLLAREDYDALFWSWSFRSGSWNEALRKAHEISPDLPVIVLSNEAEERAWLRALNAGAFDLLVAPFETGQLMAALEQASASREARLAQVAGERQAC